ncbi:putative phage-associated protein [Pseudaminobacter salicylatoxidans]|uniref:Putative phage-associated protein n=1 Tax=Pseudaminobacter salicylatoxidans TaxID=93369 RepID=A0A316BYN5_PSESE|nr:type II toxin-antitoxin system antitoxin SocA domain-containing protein [Pseudaminobacter salicylatoxidans]PWJ79773.1 putative phage-associated protein [Pseudaminobacter salicylatoxidans]
MYDARHIANWFVERARRDGYILSIMSLLKLVYIAHGWHLEMRNAPLFGNKIEAWKYGPVIPDVYAAFRGQGINVSSAIAIPNAVAISEWDSHLLEEVYRIYGRLPATTLSEMTHEPGGPWEQATKRWGWFAPIPNDLIQPHYEQKRRIASKAENNG